jgi:hypothetical protein
MDYPFIWERVKSHFRGESLSTWEDVIEKCTHSDLKSLPWYIRQTISQLKSMPPHSIGLLFYQNWVLSGLSQIIGQAKNARLCLYSKLNILLESITLACAHINIFKTLPSQIILTILQKILEVEKRKMDAEIRGHPIFSKMYCFLPQMMDMTIV